MKKINDYVLEKLKLDKNIKVINAYNEMYHAGDVCVLLNLDENILLLDLIKIKSIDLERLKITYSSSHCVIGNDEINFSNKAYVYKVKKTEKHEYLTITKSTYGVSGDNVIIPNGESIDVLTKILNNNFKLDIKRYFGIDKKIKVSSYYHYYSKKDIDLFIDCIKDNL